MGWFDSFRNYGSPTLYPSNKTPVTVDVVEWGLAFTIFIIFFSVLVVLPGFKGVEKWTILIRASIESFVLSSIVVCNYGQSWEIAEVHNIHTHYKAGMPHVIRNATVRVKIGLRCVNITLNTNPVKYKINNKTTEMIDYNERFHWNDMGWIQGRIGFGNTATHFNKEYRAAQLKGLPFPILWIAEYFTLDGEGIRWGRFYRQAGFFTHALLWLAFSTWIVTIILFKSVLMYAAYFSILTGLILFLGNIIYATVRNPLQLEIHIGDDVLKFHWGWAFQLNVFIGVLTIAIGIVVWYLYEKYPELLYHFFHVDILTDIEEFYYFRPYIGEKHNVAHTPLNNTRREPPEDDTVEYEEIPHTILRGLRRHDHYHYISPSDYLSPIKHRHYMNATPDEPKLGFFGRPKELVEKSPALYVNLP